MNYQWSTEKPAAGGLYWAFNGDEVVPVDLYLYEGRWVAFELGDNYGDMVELDEFTHWMGPLPAPDRPEEADDEEEQA